MTFVLTVTFVADTESPEPEVVEAEQVEAVEETPEADGKAEAVEEAAPEKEAAKEDEKVSGRK